MPNLTVVIFAVLSLLFAFLSLRDYLRDGKKLTISARVRLRIAVIFAAVTVLLMLLI